MKTVGHSIVISDLIVPDNALRSVVTQMMLVAAGVLALTVSAKIVVPMWPVPTTMQTFAVMTVGTFYGARLGLVTILSYLALGAAGVDVFVGSGAGSSGVAYMLGNTGGYLVGFVLAIWALGRFAENAWDRSTGLRVASLLIANALVYVPGLIWLAYLHGVDKPILAWGLFPFLLGDTLKILLAASAISAAWRFVPRSSARRQLK